MDFSLIMLFALGVTGLIWGLDRVLWLPGRERAAATLQQANALDAAVQSAQREPVLVEYARAFFPVILAVFLLRAFLVEPFRIPSGSMIPSLLVGDFILVNKYAYGVRLPVINKKVVEIGEPKRGDVMVFRFPGDPSVNYIKRVIGLPNDHVRYKDKVLYINGQRMPQTEIDSDVDSDGDPGMRRLRESLDSVVHEIQLSGSYSDTQQMEFVVPPGQYFVMGDNRDHSNDSRYWGTVPEQNIVGKAFMIWFNLDFRRGGGINWSRIGNTIN